MTDIKGSLTVQTDILRSYTVALRAALTRPSMTRESQQEVDFALTQVGTRVQKPVRVYNPRDQPIHIELLPCANVCVVSNAASRTRLPMSLVREVYVGCLHGFVSGDCLSKL